jgi:hypothetical protein
VESYNFCNHSALTLEKLKDDGPMGAQILVFVIIKLFVFAVLILKRGPFGNPVNYFNRSWAECEAGDFLTLILTAP